MDIYEKYEALAKDLDEDEREILGELEEELTEMEYAMMRNIAEEVCEPMDEEEIEDARDSEIRYLENRIAQLQEGVSAEQREQYELDRSEDIEQTGFDLLGHTMESRINEETRLPQDLRDHMLEVRTNSLDWRYEDTLCTVIREQKARAS